MIYHLQKLQLEVTNRCNLDCQMCPRKHLGVDYADMSLEVYNKAMEKIQKRAEIILTGWGEPLLNPNIIAMIKTAKQNGHRVRITTNGTLIDEKMAKSLIDSRIDSITISCDSLGSPDKNDPRHAAKGIKKSIEMLIKYRKKLKSPEIIVQPVACPDKTESLKNMIKECKSLKIDRINVVRMENKFNKIKMDFGKEKRSAKEIEKLAEKLNIRVDFAPFFAFTGAKKHLYNLFTKAFFSMGKCLKILNYLYITHDGKVTPCCALPKLYVGDILKEDLKAIWNGDKIKKFRRGVKKYCGKCNFRY